MVRFTSVILALAGWSFVLLTLSVPVDGFSAEGLNIYDFHLPLPAGEYQPVTIASDTFIRGYRSSKALVVASFDRKILSWDPEVESVFYIYGYPAISKRITETETHFGRAYTARLETIFLQRGIEANQFYVTVQLIDDSVESFDLARDLLSRITFDKEGSSKLPPMPEATMVLEPSLKKAEVVAKIPNRAAELETFNLACETQQPDRDGRPPYYDLECKSVSDPEVRGYIHLKELDASRKATNFLFRSLSRLNKGSAYFECAPLGSNPSLRNCVLER